MEQSKYLIDTTFCCLQLLFESFNALYSFIPFVLDSKHFLFDPLHRACWTEWLKMFGKHLIPQRQQREMANDRPLLWVRTTTEQVRGCQSGPGSPTCHHCKSTNFRRLKTFADSEKKFHRRELKFRKFCALICWSAIRCQRWIVRQLYQASTKLKSSA